MEPSFLIRAPFRAALLTSLGTFIVSLAVTQPALWQYFSWIAMPVPYFPGTARDIAPILNSHCDPSIANAIAAASMIMLAAALAVFAAAVTICLRAGARKARPLEKPKGVASFVFDGMRWGLLLLGLGLSFGAVRHSGSPADRIPT